MAANRFATMLHRKTNRITVILVYAVLEWILILLLFSSSLFSHLIIKFAEFFGLKPPCLWCTRIDHIFDSSSDGNKNLHRDLLCEAHAKEVSRFGFCSIHRKLAESQDMCNDCLFSMPEFACFSGIKDFGLTPNDEMDGKQTPRCSCCGMSLLCRKTSSLDDFFCTHVSKEGDHGFEYLERGDSDEKTQVHEDDNVEKIDNCLKVEERVFEESFCKQHLEYFLDHTDHNLVPVELVKDEEIANIKCDDNSENQEFITFSDSEVEKREALADDNGRFIDFGVHNEHRDAICEALADDNGGFIDLDVDNEPKDKVLEALVDDCAKFIDLGVDNEPKDAVSESIVIEEDENSLVFQAKENLVNHCEALSTFSLGHWPSEDVNDAQEAAEAKILDSRKEGAESEETTHVHNENEAVVSIGTEIPELDMSDELQIKESVHKHECNHEDNLSEIEMLGPGQVRVREIELQPLSLDQSASFNLETQENEEDKVPDTPASLDSFIQLHKKVHFLEKRDSWADESFDGSVTSELDDGVVTIESLISALKAERKALKILYTEFEEERNASAVAANQTMAMINRLQEEKAAMQMEALQYQRMMEEQAEYDQDALQLMNELMVKRENEKRELEMELEECRKKLFDYETKEKSKLLRNGFSSSPSMNGTQELEEETASHNAVIETNEPLFDFDHERLSILDQLSVLEEKLFTVNDATDQHSIHTEDTHLITSSDNHGVHVNGSLDDTVESKQHRKWIGFGSSGHKGKSLLPLFDAISDDQMVQSNGVHSTEQDYEDEICHLYERLETLEADKEFLKQCISSLKQGDKELVHEILHSLKELRNVELQARTRQPQDYCW